jgi:hypothetical protein
MGIYTISAEKENENLTGNDKRKKYIKKCKEYKTSPRHFYDKTRFLVIVQKVFCGENVEWYNTEYSSPEAYSRAFKKWVGINKTDLIEKIKILTEDEKSRLLEKLIERIKTRKRGENIKCDESFLMKKS